MKKIQFILGTIALFAISAIAAYSATDTVTAQNDTDLTTIEAMARCEISPEPSDNVGYCTFKLGTTEGSCVSDADPGCVRCSGNI